METKDIIGKEFTAVKFPSDDRLLYDKMQYSEVFGEKGKIINFHRNHPEYTNVQFPSKNNMMLHFPTELVLEQVMKNEPIEDIFTVLARIKKQTE